MNERPGMKFDYRGLMSTPIDIDIADEVDVDYHEPVNAIYDETTYPNPEAMLSYVVLSETEKDQLLSTGLWPNRREDYDTFNLQFTPIAAARWTSYLVSTNYLKPTEKWYLLSVRVDSRRLYDGQQVHYLQPARVGDYADGAT